MALHGEGGEDTSRRAAVGPGGAHRSTWAWRTQRLTPHRPVRPARACRRRLRGAQRPSMAPQVDPATHARGDADRGAPRSAAARPPHGGLGPSILHLRGIGSGVASAEPSRADLPAHPEDKPRDTVDHGHTCDRDADPGTPARRTTRQPDQQPALRLAHDAGPPSARRCTGRRGARTVARYTATRPRPAQRVRPAVHGQHNASNTWNTINYMRPTDALRHASLPLPPASPIRPSAPRSGLTAPSR